MEREESHSHLSGFLTRQQCTLMRGVAIICIILHNYIHNLDLSLEENEFRFYALKSRLFTDMLAQFGPRDWMQIISYLGHYGVPVFIFLSGFGLVKKYESPRAPQPSAARFIRFNYLKLLQLMLPVAIITLCLHPLLTPDQRITPAIVAGQLTMLGNLVPNLSPLIGPYWFFGAIFELYIVYWLLLRKRGNAVLIVFMVICLVPAFFITSHKYGMQYYHINFPAQMLPFGLGILMARTRVSRFFAELSLLKSAVCFLLTFLIFVELELWRWTWPIAPVALLLSSLFGLKLLWAAKGVREALVWVGGISAYIFAIHSVVRDVFYLFGEEQSQLMVLLYFTAVILAGWGMSLTMRKVPSPKLMPAAAAGS